jgi:shikimate kinase
MLDGTNLYLIGMMGAGKSTIAKLLAPRLDYQFIDTDSLIESCSGISIPEIFATLGETEFRQIESKVLSQVSSFTRLAIATGGGIVLQRQNWSHLRDGIIIWLDVDLEILFQRLTYSDNERPLLKTENPFATLTAIYEQRRIYYAQADIQVKISNEDHSNQVCDRVLQLLAERIEINRLKSPSKN